MLSNEHIAARVINGCRHISDERWLSGRSWGSRQNTKPDAQMRSKKAFAMLGERRGTSKQKSGER
jgi:hypothetical protein